MSVDTIPHVPTVLENGFITTATGTYPIEANGFEKMHVAPEIVIALFKTHLPYNRDFAEIFIPPGKSTPLQIVQDGNTVEYPTAGSIAIIIQHASGTIEVLTFHDFDPETYHTQATYEIGDIICCVALGRYGSRSIEESNPAYETGMFDFIEEHDPRVSKDFIDIRNRILASGKERTGFTAKYVTPTTE